MTNKEFFIQTWQAEIPRTLIAVNGLPKDMEKLSYRCNEKSRSAAELIGHFLSHAEELANATKTFIADENSDRTFESIEEAANYFETNANKVIENLKNTDDKTWEEQMVEFQVNGHKIFAAPMTNIFWSFMFDTIHHRGQLSTYYRHMGVRNPNMYGPTAEDMEERMAKNNAS